MTNWAKLMLFAVLSLAVVAPTALAEKKAEKKDEKGAAAEGATSSESATSAEFVCEADVSFTWKRTPPQQTKLNEQGKQTPVEPDPSVLEPIEEFYTRVGQTGSAEEDTKNKLASVIPAAESQARRACEELHQEESSCIARKLRTNQTDLHILDYASRTALRKSIEKDCAGNKGLCLATKASPIVCYSPKPPAASASSEAAGGKEEDKKKGAKK